MSLLSWSDAPQRVENEVRMRRESGENEVRIHMGNCEFSLLFVVVVGVVVAFVVVVVLVVVLLVVFVGVVVVVV